MHKIYPHGELCPIAPRLWEVRGTLSFPLERKMVVHRLADETLLLHSVVAMNDEGMRALEALGRPSVLVIPHTMHTLDAPFYAARYPDLKVIATESISRKLAGKVRVDATPEQALPALGVNPHRIPGMKFDEVVLDVPTGDGAGRALLFTDCVGRGTPKGLMMRLLGPPAGEGVARIFKLRQLADKAKLRAFLEEMATTPNLRMVMGSHSVPVTDDAPGFLRRAASGV